MQPGTSRTATTTASDLVVPARFTGPPRSANGGYVSGRLASFVPTHEAAAVTLRVPPPLDTTMAVDRDGDVARLRVGDRLVAEAAPGTLDIDLIELVDYADAQEAATRYPGLASHPFPTCFVCGTEREPGDGLRLFPGPVTGRPDTVAAAWVPHHSLAGGEPDEVAEEFVWAALDCPGGWAVDLAGRPMVLGRMTAQVDALPVVGDRCVVMGRLLGQEGRKTFTSTTAYDGDGRVLGRAHAVWLTVDAATLATL